jgi:hypothetical protein
LLSCRKATTLAGNFLGPTVSDVGNLINAGVQSDEMRKENMMKGNERPEDQLDTAHPFKKLATGWIPYGGPAIKNLAYGEWPKRQREVFRENLKNAMKDAIASGDRRKIKEVMQQNPTQNGMNVLQDLYREVQLEALPADQKARYDAIKKRKEELNYSPIL